MVGGCFVSDRCWEIRNQYGDPQQSNKKRFLPSNRAINMRFMKTVFPSSSTSTRLVNAMFFPDAQHVFISTRVFRVHLKIVLFFVFLPNQTLFHCHICPGENPGHIRFANRKRRETALYRPWNIADAFLRPYYVPLPFNELSQSYRCTLVFAINSIYNLFTFVNRDINGSDHILPRYNTRSNFSFTRTQP